MLINNTPFYFLLPQQLLESCRQEAARNSISTASFVREALIAYLDQKDLSDPGHPKSPLPICDQHT
jgi:hypothetical protein